MAYNSNSLFFESTLNLTEVIKPNEIPESNNIENILLNKIKERIGNKCIQRGYVKKDSIKILERSIGKINSAHFNGNIHYNVRISLDICIPHIDTVLNCKVVGKNPAGIMCINGPLQILISPEIHSNVDSFNTINKGDIISIIIIKYQTMLNDDHIRVIGKLSSQ